MKLELTIKTDYLPSWGAYEGIRELVQNGHDAKTELGASFEVRHRKDTSTLVIENQGCTLPHEALLLGHTTKVGRGDTIGKFGEGLKLGILALVRRGHVVKIRSGSEVWTPSIQRSEKFAADVLVFDIAGGRDPKERVQIEIGQVSAKAWDDMRGHFLFLQSIPASQQVRTSSGTLLLGSEHRGRLYVKGIFVQNSDLSYGYDFSNATVDRDRRMIASWDRQYECQCILREALGSRPDLFPTFAELLETEAEDVIGFGDYGVDSLPDAFKDAVAKRFTDRGGEDAVPVSTLAESAEIGHLGKRGLVTPKPLRKVLESRLGTIEENKAKLAKETIRLVSWHELSADERANLHRAVELVNRGAAVSLDDIDVAEYRDPKLQGLYHGATGRISLSKSALASRAKTLQVLVHETAHKVGGGDGEKDHVQNLESIWSAIAESLSDVQVAVA